MKNKKFWITSAIVLVVVIIILVATSGKVASKIKLLKNSKLIADITGRVFVSDDLKENQPDIEVSLLTAGMDKIKSYPIGNVEFIELHDRNDLAKYRNRPAIFMDELVQIDSIGYHDNGTLKKERLSGTYTQAMWFNWI